MHKNTLNILVDLVAFLAVLALLATGILLRFVLPPGAGRGNWVVWGFTRHEWGSVHFWIAVGAAVVFLIHVALHWTWVWNVSRNLARRPGQAGHAQRYLGGAGVLVATVAGLGLFWGAASRNVQSGPSTGPGMGGRADEDRPGRGQGWRFEEGLDQSEEEDQYRPMQRRRRGRRAEPAWPDYGDY